MINTDNKTILICYNIEMYGILYKPETRHWCPLKPSIHPCVQFPSNRSHKVLLHVSQRSTQSKPWSPAEHSVNRILLIL
jgi:hypothetical protein